MNSFHDDLDNAYRTDSNRVTGGVVRWSANQEQPAAPEPVAPSIRTGNSVTRWTASGNEIRTEEVGGVIRATANHSGTPGGSRVVTLQRSGTQQTVELEPGNPASRTDVATAHRMGVIQRDAAGNWIDAGQVQTFHSAPLQQPQDRAQAEAQHLERQQAAQLADAGFDPAAQAQWQAAIEPVPQAAFDAAQARLVAAVAAGSADGVEEAALKLAESTGMQPDEAAALVAQGVTHYTTAIERVTARVGVTDLGAFGNWARRNDPHVFSHALRMMIVAADATSLRSLATRYQHAALKGGR